MDNPTFVDEEDIPMVHEEKIMMITTHRIQAGWMRHRLRYPMLQ